MIGDTTGISGHEGFEETHTGVIASLSDWSYFVLLLLAAVFPLCNNSTFVCVFEILQTMDSHIYTTPCLRP